MDGMVSLRSNHAAVCTYEQKEKQTRLIQLLPNGVCHRLCLPSKPHLIIRFTKDMSLYLTINNNVLKYFHFVNFVFFFKITLLIIC